MRFDVIGDIHGHYDQLVKLLERMGYRVSDGVWRHPERTAVFVGDLIDRGPGQLGVIDLVRGMVEAGAAQCIMGNHEFNAIAWATENPDRPGEYLRSRTKPENLEQHAAFLAAVKDKAQHEEIVAWFKTLPLWLDLGGLRVVHACWHEESMDVLRPLLGPRNTLTEQALRLGSTRGNPIFDAIEVVCKGPEVKLPRDVAFADKEGKPRHEVRVRWWAPELKSLREAAIGPPEQMRHIPDTPLPSDWKAHHYVGPPVIFGHYWFSGKPKVISSQFACVDYSVAKDGPLVAYQWDGEAALRSEKLVWA